MNKLSGQDKIEVSDNITKENIQPLTDLKVVDS
jgi:hypothetical protein